MRIALIAPPFIAVPPAAYGGTELFIAHLANGLHARGHDVTVYANGDSQLHCKLKWRYRHADWPVASGCAGQLKNADHTAWAMRDASQSADLIHLNDIVGAPFTLFADQPAVLTIHHPHEPVLSEQYARYPAIHYVAISAAQARREPMGNTSVVDPGRPSGGDTFRGEDEKGDDGGFLCRLAACR